LEGLVERQRLPGVGRALNVAVPGVLEEPLQEPDVSRLVVDDEDSRRRVRFVAHHGHGIAMAVPLARRVAKYL
jgi:hypothetical protein